MRYSIRWLPWLAVLLAGCDKAGAPVPGEPADQPDWALSADQSGLTWHRGDSTLTLRWIGRLPGGMPEAVDDADPVEFVWREGARRISASCFSASGDALAVFHLRANPPGGLEFEVSWGEGGAIQGRRLLVNREARAWVFPMESDVTESDGAIRVTGEGEALVVAGLGEGAVRAMRGFGVEGDRVDDVAALLGKLVAAKD